jgi:hypothetical protein
MSYFIEATRNTPKISFDTENGTFEISGRSMPENTRKFYDPVISWIREYNPEEGKSISLTLNLTYLNTSSTIAMLEILKTFAKFKESNNPLKVFWYYEQYDEDMKLAGEDIASISELEFEYIMEE